MVSTRGNLARATRGTCWLLKTPQKDVSISIKDKAEKCTNTTQVHRAQRMSGALSWKDSEAT